MWIRKPCSQMQSTAKFIFFLHSAKIFKNEVLNLWLKRSSQEGYTFVQYIFVFKGGTLGSILTLHVQCARA